MNNIYTGRYARERKENKTNNMFALGALIYFLIALVIIGIYNPSF